MKDSSKTITTNITVHWKTWLIPVLYLCVLWLLPDNAIAAPWDDAADGILENLNGGLTRTLAILSLVGLGIAGYIGKLSWKWAGSIMGGIVVIFGSAAIVDLVIGWVA